MITWLKKLPIIAVAIFIMACAVNLFLGPHDIAAGGLSGLGLIVEAATNGHIDRSIVVFVGNAILLLISYVILGKETVINSIIGAFMLPIFMRFVPREMLIEDPMLSMVIGSVVSGAAMIILYNYNASSGGTSIPPLIFKKLFRLPTSVGMFFSDGVIVILTIFVFGIEPFFFAIASIGIGAMTMEYLETGLNRKKLVYIISDKHENIKDEILNEIVRGATILNAVGAYTQKERKVLMVTLGRRDYRKVLDIIKKHDPNAFVTAANVADVHGNGFTFDE